VIVSTAGVTVLVELLRKTRIKNVLRIYLKGFKDKILICFSGLVLKSFLEF